MGVKSIDFENKTFEMNSGETYPLMLYVDESIMLEDFQV